AEIARVGRADRGAHGGNFIFRLNGVHTERLVATEFVQDITGGRDGIRSHYHGHTGEFCGGNEAPSCRSVTADVSIPPLLCRVAGYFGAVMGDLRRFAESVACFESENVREGDFWLFCKLLIEPLD